MYLYLVLILSFSEFQDEDMESETGSSDGDEPKDVPPLLPLSNGLHPHNFAALFASASGN